MPSRRAKGGCPRNRFLRWWCERRSRSWKRINRHWSGSGLRHLNYNIVHITLAATELYYECSSPETYMFRPRCLWNDFKILWHIRKQNEFKMALSRLEDDLLSQLSQARSNLNLQCLPNTFHSYFHVCPCLSALPCFLQGRPSNNSGQSRPDRGPWTNQGRSWREECNSNGQADTNIVHI